MRRLDRPARARRSRPDRATWLHPGPIAPRARRWRFRSSLRSKSPLSARLSLVLLEASARIERRRRGELLVELALAFAHAVRDGDLHDSEKIAGAAVRLGQAASAQAQLPSGRGIRLDLDV